MPAMSSSTAAGSGVQFVVHWLNNKELHFTHEAEHLMEEISRAASAKAASTAAAAESSEPGETTDTDNEDAATTTSSEKGEWGHSVVQ